MSRFYKKKWNDLTTSGDMKKKHKYIWTRMHIGAWWCTSIIAEYCTPSAFPLRNRVLIPVHVIHCVCVWLSHPLQATQLAGKKFVSLLSLICQPVNVRKFLGKNRAKLQEFKQKKYQWTIILSQQIFCSFPLEELIACDRTFYF